MKRQGISQYELLKKHNISSGQLDRLRKNESVTTFTINRLCTILMCNVEDIMEFIPDKSSYDTNTKKQSR